MVTYSLIGFSYLGFSLLLLAAVTAFASRCKKPFWRIFWPILVSIGPIVPILLILLVFGYISEWLSWYFLSMMVFYIIGATIILKYGLKGFSGDERKSLPCPRFLLVFMSGIFLFAFIASIDIADIRVLQQLEIVRAKATSTIRDMLPPKPPDNQNAHLVYEEAYWTLTKGKNFPHWFRDSEDPSFDICAPEIAESVEENKKVAEITVKARELSGYSTDIYHPIQPHHYRDICRFLSLYARTNARKGDISKSFHFLEDIQKMADHLRRFPTVYSFFIISTIEHIRYRALEYILSHSHGFPEKLFALPVSVSSTVLKDLISSIKVETQIYLGEYAEDLSFSQFPSMLRIEKNNKYAFISPGFGWRIFRVFGGPSVIRGLTDIVTYWMDKDPESYEDLNSIYKAYHNAKVSGELASMLNPFLPRYDPISRAMKCDVYMGLCDLAMAVTAYRARNNSYPGKLEKLVPEYIDRILLDPFDSKPLKMKSVEGGLDLYSVGSEKEDEYHGKIEPIHFYMGKEAYEKFRVTPAKEERLNEAQRKQ